ncbi:hypothetical protein CKO28_04510 [Rhodovibrio sodomensis]|uniref:Metallohydrolase n=1 Tax=Rhodovibrio sodomensis TaxID=1088 RepID=A0ABS1DAC4_9PROT|nr:hypothetical protein [Rhodovibrio sodomensis]MBK1667305.1 hypothetical protein [Rhodovibrio sodomensis]
MAYMTFFPLGNADSTLIRLADDQLVLFDFADTRDPKDALDRRCDLRHELRKEMNFARKEDFSVVCFTHLDDDHVCGAQDFFWFDHAEKYQGPGRAKIAELWVPAAAITEEGIDGDARVIRQEARHRLKRGSGVKVFSHPEALRSFLAENGIRLQDRMDCIVDAGRLVPGFSKLGPERAEFFVHSPFAWRSDERGLEDRNQDSIVVQATFSEQSSETCVLLGADADHETLTQIVKTTKRHGNENRLEWDVLKLFHHCSYLSLGPDRGIERTQPVEEVDWLMGEQARDGCIVISPSKDIPAKGTVEDRDSQPPHRQAANYYKWIVGERDGEFRVTMETPNKARPKPFRVDITAMGAAVALVATTSIGTATSTPARAG